MPPVLSPTEIPAGSNDIEPQGREQRLGGVWPCGMTVPEQTRSNTPPPLTSSEPVRLLHIWDGYVQYAPFAGRDLLIRYTTSLGVTNNDT